MKKILSVILCVLLLFSVSVVGFAQSANVNGCNWMSIIKDDTSLADISMPGTHDTAAQYVAFGIKSRCQDKTIPEQLNLGARFLDIRLSASGGQLKLVHNFINCRKGSGFTAPKLFFDEVTKYCVDFLSKNTKECIILFIKEDFGSASDFDELLAKYISKNSAFWYTENRIPNIGEVRGKIVLMNRFAKSESALDDQNGGINLTNFPPQGENQGSFQVVSMDSFSGNMISTYTVQDRYKYSKSDKWSKAVLPTLEINKIEGELLINFLSTAAGVSPEINAKYINEKFMEYELDSGKCYGAVLFDFISEELARKVYSCNSSVNDTALSPASFAEADIPAPRHGIIKFLDGLWAKLIEALS